MMNRPCDARTELPHKNVAEHGSSIVARLRAHLTRRQPDVRGDLLAKELHDRCPQARPSQLRRSVRHK